MIEPSASSLAPLRVGELLDLSVTILVRISPYLIAIILCIVLASEIPKTFMPDNFYARVGGPILKSILMCYLYAAAVLLTSRIRLNLPVSQWQQLRKINVRDVIGVGALFVWIYVMTILLMICLLIPGIIYSVNRLLVFPVYLIERVTMGEALWRSKYLMTRGKWYSPSNPLMRISVVMFVLFLIVGSLTSSLMFEQYFGWGDQIGGYARFILGILGSSLAGLITLFGYVAYTNFYFDLRARYEGLDLYARLEELEFNKAGLI